MLVFLLMPAVTMRRTALHGRLPAFVFEIRRYAFVFEIRRYTHSYLRYAGP